MDKDWRPLAELRPGHYAAGLLDDGHEANIYRAGAFLCDAATGEKITRVIGWRRQKTLWNFFRASAPCRPGIRKSVTHRLKSVRLEGHPEEE